MQVKLKVLGGAHSGKEIVIKDEKFFIGRSDSCQLRPRSDSVSRKHCAILQKDGKVIVADLRSRNGTFLNDNQLQPERAKVISNGDVLRVGQLEFELLIEHGLGGAKKPEVSGLKDAATRIATESAVVAQQNSDSFDVADWLIEADMIDRSAKAPVLLEPETKMIAMDETSSIEVDNQTVAESVEKTNRVDKGPMKLPKMKHGPATQNSRAAAEETLKKFFGGR